jgi:hypothetical protein
MEIKSQWVQKALIVDGRQLHAETPKVTTRCILGHWYGGPRDVVVISE